MLLPAESLLLTPEKSTGAALPSCLLCDAVRLGQSRTRLHERCIVSTETARACVSTCKVYNIHVTMCVCLHIETWCSRGAKCMTVSLNMT